MRIYTRAEQGLRPPTRPLRTGLLKKYIIIHHTGSANGVLRFSTEAALQRMWQRDHIRKYNASDMCHAVCVFQSGRILEGRMPWDSNNGGAYQPGGDDGIGIEHQGTFSGNMRMTDPQYASSVWLCAKLIREQDITLEPMLLGHQQIPNNSTSCPGSLMKQLPQMKLDIIRELEGETEETKEVEEMNPIEPSTINRFMDVWTGKYSHWLHLENTTDENCGVVLEISGQGFPPKKLPGFPLGPREAWKQDLNSLLTGHGITDSRNLTVLSTKEVTAFIREW